MEIYSHPDIQEILELPGNSICCDCNSEKAKWSSLNNGVFLCLKCASIHRGLGVEISNIRSLQIDSWTDKQILYLSKGGNNKFKNNLSEYNIDLNTKIELKYKTRAADYYRKVLKNEVEKISNKDYKEIEVIKPNLEEGKEIINSQNNQNKINISSQEKANQEKKEEGIFGTFGSFFDSVKKKAGDTVDKISLGFNEFGGKIKEAGDTVVDYAKAGGKFIIDKSEQAINSDFVKGIQKSAESGFNSVVEKTKVLLNNDKNNHKQNINPNLLKNNESQEKKNEDIQMSEIIDNNNNNNINDINKNNSINNVDNANNLNNPDNANNDNLVPNKDIKNEDLEKNDKKSSEENQKKNIPENDKDNEKIQNEDIKKDEHKENQKENIPENEKNNIEEIKKDNKVENGDNNAENSNNVIDNKMVKEESVEKGQENPQNA